MPNLNFIQASEFLGSSSKEVTTFSEKVARNGKELKGFGDELVTFSEEVPRNEQESADYIEELLRFVPQF